MLHSVGLLTTINLLLNRPGV